MNRVIVVAGTLAGLAVVAWMARVVPNGYRVPTRAIEPHYDRVQHVRASEHAEV